MRHNTFPRAGRAFTVLAAALTLAAGSAVAARADDNGPPPAVARISVATGDVGVKHGDADQVAGAVNAPLEAGDYVTTGGDGRVEIQLDPSNVVRAASGTQLRFTQLDGSSDTVQLAQGTVELRVLQEDEDHVSLQTPSVDVVPDQAGAYLVTVDSDGQTFVTARSGSLDVNTPQGSQTLDPGKTMQINGNANDPQYQFVDEVAATDFDQWTDSRDQQLTVADASQNVNPDMLGAPDLDQYGQWTNVSGYGPVWQPTDVSANWTPYSDGNWTYQNYYGWTWVSAEPWGWAPYHYGSWAFIGGSWGWVPGPRYVTPVYAPARVAFFGFGSGVGVGLSLGFGFGNVGWVPLAPGDPFHPWWGPNRVAIASNNYYNYRNLNHGLVGLPVTGWQHGNFNQIARVQPGQVGSLHSFAGRLPLNPTSENYRFTNRSVGAGVQKPVYSRFSDIHPIGAPSRQAASTTNGWQHFSSASPRANAPSYARGYAPGGASQGAAWQHFGSAPRQQYQSLSQRPYQQGAYQQRQQYQPAYQQRQQYQSTYQRQYQQGAYQQRAYQQRAYQQRAYQQSASYQRPQASYQRSSYPSYQRQSYPSYQRQSYGQRPSGNAPARTSSRGGSGSPHPHHGPGTM
jgi:hypothetical protein